MQTIFTAAELKENYQILLRLLGQLQSEVIRNLSKIIRRFKTVSFSGKRSLKNPINGGSYGIRNPANSHSIYLLSL